MPRCPTRVEAGELPQTVEIKIREPQDHKGFMIIFEAWSEKECTTLNRAVIDVLTGEGIRYFHQYGPTIRGGENTPGPHGWEIRSEDVGRERLEELLPRIKQRAKELSGNIRA